MAQVLERQYGDGRRIRTLQEFACLFAIYLLTRARVLGALKVVAGDEDERVYYAILV